MTLADGIWPKDDDTDDRVERQIKLGYILADYLHEHNKTEGIGQKVILVSNAHSLYERFTAGDTVFRKNCPLTNCFLTKNIERYKRTADAIIIVRLRKSSVQQFQPKPYGQVIILCAK